jgi:hypothetical protein
MKYSHKQGPVSGIKDKYARVELARAHGMVTLLSLVVIMLLTVMRWDLELSTALFATIVVLLGLVAVFSGCITIGLMQKSRK